MANISISVDEPGRGTRELKFAKPVITIGRSSGCDVRVAGDQVSSHHARLRIYSNRAVIEDLNSTNGIKVDGRSINGSFEIGRGNVIELGAGGPRLQIAGGLPALEGHQAAATPGPEPAKSSSHTPYYMLAAAGILLFVFIGGSLLIGGGLFWWKAKTSGIVSSLDDENSIAEAVALVVAGWEFQVTDPPLLLPLVTGTAFAVDEDGYLITNNHVVDEKIISEIQKLRSDGKKIPWKVWVAFHGNFYDAEVVHKSRNQDMCVLKVKRNLPYVFRLARQTDFPRRSSVTILGYPGAAQHMSLSSAEDADELLKEKDSPLKTDLKSSFKPRDFNYDLKEGIVSRVIKDKFDHRWIEHDAATSGGNSGGPLCRHDGVVVAVHTRGNPERSGFGFAFMIGQYEEELSEVIKGLKWAR